MDGVLRAFGTAASPGSPWKTPNKTDSRNDKKHRRERTPGEVSESERVTLPIRYSPGQKTNGTPTTDDLSSSGMFTYKLVGHHSDDPRCAILP